jgi:hypothetical protein
MMGIKGIPVVQFLADDPDTATFMSERSHHVDPAGVSDRFVGPI